MRHFRYLPALMTMLVFGLIGVVTTLARTSGETMERRASAAPQGAAAPAPARPAFAMTIAGLTDGGILPLKNTLQGGEVSPGINWTNAPAGTVSFVLVMHDMNAIRNRTNEDNVQWMVWNIPSAAEGIPEGVPNGVHLPSGAWQISASGPVYRGPGRGNDPFNHHYAFELFAVDKMVDVPGGAKVDAFETRAKVLEAIQGHILGKAMYMGLYTKIPQ